MARMVRNATTTAIIMVVKTGQCLKINRQRQRGMGIEFE